MPRRAERNTYRLPNGEAIRRELVRYYRAERQRFLGLLGVGQKDLGWQEVQFPSLGAGLLDLAERMTPHLSLLWDREGQRFLGRIGLDPDAWEVTSPKLAPQIERQALEFCEATLATTDLNVRQAVEGVRQSLREGVLDRGESVAVLTKRIKAVFTEAETWRARRIAMTEASRAVHGADLAAAQQSGVVTGFKWLLSGDACPLCVTIARRVPAIPLGLPFAELGDNPTFKDIKHPPAHPHCRCSLEPVLDIDEQPAWGNTLIQPEPEPQDYAEGEGPNV